LEGCCIAAGRVPFICHPKASFFEAVRISSFKGWGIEELKKMRFSRCLVENTGLLRITEWVDEHSTSLRTLLTMMDLKWA
jgi:hypothetical protein